MSQSTSTLWLEQEKQLPGQVRSAGHAAGHGAAASPVRTSTAATSQQSQAAAASRARPLHKADFNSGYGQLWWRLRRAQRMHDHNYTALTVTWVMRGTASVQDRPGTGKPKPTSTNQRRLSQVRITVMKRNTSAPPNVLPCKELACSLFFQKFGVNDAFLVNWTACLASIAVFATDWLTDIAEASTAGVARQIGQPLAHLLTSCGHDVGRRAQR